MFYSLHTVKHYPPSRRRQGTASNCPTCMFRAQALCPVSAPFRRRGPCLRAGGGTVSILRGLPRGTLSFPVDGGTWICRDLVACRGTLVCRDLRACRDLFALPRHFEFRIAERHPGSSTALTSSSSGAASPSGASGSGEAGIRGIIALGSS